MKKIRKGHYQAEYKGQPFYVLCSPDESPLKWIYTINGFASEYWFTTRQIAIKQACTEIDRLAGQTSSNTKQLKLAKIQMHGPVLLDLVKELLAELKCYQLSKESIPFVVRAEKLISKLS